MALAWAQIGRMAPQPVEHRIVLQPLRSGKACSGCQGQLQAPDRSQAGMEHATGGSLGHRAVEAAGHLRQGCRQGSGLLRRRELQQAASRHRRRHGAPGAVHMFSRRHLVRLTEASAQFVPQQQRLEHGAQRSLQRLAQGQADRHHVQPGAAMGGCIPLHQLVPAGRCRQHLGGAPRRQARPHAGQNDRAGSKALLLHHQGPQGWLAKPGHRDGHGVDQHQPQAALQMESCPIAGIEAQRQRSQKRISLGGERGHHRVNIPSLGAR